MILRLFLTILFTLSLLTLKAWFDVSRQKKGIWTAHGHEWSILAFLTLVLTFLTIHFPHYDWGMVFSFDKRVVSDLLFLASAGWSYFDLIHNYFAGEKLDYVSKPSKHQSVTDKFLTFVGVEYQYIVKIDALLIAVFIDFLILK